MRSSPDFRLYTSTSYSPGRNNNVSEPAADTTSWRRLAKPCRTRNQYSPGRLYVHTRVPSSFCVKEPLSQFRLQILLLNVRRFSELRNRRAICDKVDEAARAIQLMHLVPLFQDCRVVQAHLHRDIHRIWIVADVEFEAEMPRRLQQIVHRRLGGHLMD